MLGSNLYWATGYPEDLYRNLIRKISEVSEELIASILRIKQETLKKQEAILTYCLILLP